MKKPPPLPVRLLVAFVLMVAAIESLQRLSAWWHAGRPPPGLGEWIALLALLVAGLAWWRHSVFTCRHTRCRSSAGETPPER